jgi:hypothetical protein
MNGVERLAVVSKVLFDTRLLELKRENEALKLKLFWKEHNNKELNVAMARANETDGGPQCSCLACAVSGRFISNNGEVAEQKPCTFKPWFEQVLREHDMSVGHVVDVPRIDGSLVDSDNNVFDDDQHFTNFAGADWRWWTYGSKLWKATSVRDPELAKLERLFRTLHTLDGTGSD